MGIAKILFLAAVILFLLAALGSTLVPSPMLWALFCMALGLLLQGFDLRLQRR